MACGPHGHYNHDAEHNIGSTHRRPCQRPTNVSEGMEGGPKKGWRDYCSRIEGMEGGAQERVERLPVAGLYRETKTAQAPHPPSPHATFELCRSAHTLLIQATQTDSNYMATLA
jgi:hypothetical protein